MGKAGKEYQLFNCDEFINSLYIFCNNQVSGS